MLVCAGKIEQFTFAKTIGIGLVEVAINLTKILLEEEIKELIFIGSFGLYNKGEIGDIIEIKQACNIELSSLLNFSYSPLKSDFDKSELTINSSNYITTNQDLALKLFKQGIYGENMEVFSFFEVCKSFNIKAKAILVATNYCNETAHNDFIKNHSFAMKKLTDYLKNEGLI